ncbi:hypothetical protein E6O75_ATG08725 [Venturia nashicola]|uniref:Uncharacterized protein n=1 Tax=Venturia nashicola TaxID=86259 RepID=A0A4Z1NPA4_9PEZI|nr:hypothetical protein E6O75_ATG08725 [Venturia nashicola]
MPKVQTYKTYIQPSIARGRSNSAAGRGHTSSTWRRFTRWRAVCAVNIGWKDRSSRENILKLRQLPPNETYNSSFSQRDNVCHEEIPVPDKSGDGPLVGFSVQLGTSLQVNINCGIGTLLGSCSSTEGHVRAGTQNQCMSQNTMPSLASKVRNWELHLSSNSRGGFAQAFRFSRVRWL